MGSSPVTVGEVGEYVACGGVGQDGVAGGYGYADEHVAGVFGEGFRKRYLGDVASPLGLFEERRLEEFYTEDEAYRREYYGEEKGHAPAVRGEVLRREELRGCY
jgi:hypothetical protein